MKIPSTEAQNNFGKYLKYAEANEEIIITKQGKAVAKIIPYQEMIKESSAEYRTNGDWVSYEEFVDPINDSILVYSFNNNDIVDSQVYKKIDNHSVRSAIYEGLEIALQDIFV